MARDVPQAPWTLAADDDLVLQPGNASNEDQQNDVNNNSKGLENLPDSDTIAPTNRRKGRASVEEVVAWAVRRRLGGSCRLHGCGREDIDVRCLGNGRPFVLEVTNYTSDATDEALDEIAACVQAREGLNGRGDVEIAYLRRADKGLWESMQTIAELKKKSYTCLVWSARALTPEDLRSLERMSTAELGSDVDEEGQRGIKVGFVVISFLF